MTTASNINPQAQKALEQLLQLEQTAPAEQLFIISYIIPVVSILCEQTEDFASSLQAQLQQNIALDKLSADDEQQVWQLVNSLGVELA